MPERVGLLCAAPRQVGRCDFGVKQPPRVRSSKATTSVLQELRLCKEGHRGIRANPKVLADAQVQTLAAETAQLSHGESPKITREPRQRPHMMQQGSPSLRQYLKLSWLRRHAPTRGTRLGECRQ
eukprot:9546675-Alexandrium_andersonii.AAC.1